MRSIVALTVVMTCFPVFQMCEAPISAAENAPASASAEQFAHKVLATRVYRLNYVANNDLEDLITRQLSKRGKLDIPPSHRDTIIVRDDEEILKTVDCIVAAFDVQPPQVLIEAMILQVGPNKGPNSAATTSILDSALGSKAVDKSKTVDTADGRDARDEALRFGWVDGNTKEFIRTLESLREIKLLAYPRMLVLDKQRAEICLGSLDAKQPNVETRVRFRPFVLTDGTIRLETHLERSAKKGRSADAPEVENCLAVTTNVMIRSGKTVVFGGFSDVEVPFDTKKTPTSADTKSKNELLVVLTPRLWKPESPSNAKVSDPHPTTRMRAATVY